MSFDVRVESTLKNKNYSQKVNTELRLLLTNSAVRVEGEAKLLAPVRTGRLRSEIFRRVEIFHANVIAPTAYSGYVEFGTMKQRAQPFMRTGLDYSLGDIRRFGRNYLLRVLSG